MKSWLSTRRTGSRDSWLDRGPRRRRLQEERGPGAGASSTFRLRQGFPGSAGSSFRSDGRSDVPHRQVTDRNGQSMFQFGYYMPGVNGTVTIVGQAVDAHGCVIGKGMVTVANVVAGQTTPLDASSPPALRITAVAGGCDAGATGGGRGSGGASGGRGGAGGKDAAGGSSVAGRAAATPAPAGRRKPTAVWAVAPSPRRRWGWRARRRATARRTTASTASVARAPARDRAKSAARPRDAGKCLSVTGTPRAGHAACAGAGTPCGGTCDGASRTVCTYPGTTQVLPAASCTGRDGDAGRDLRRQRRVSGSADRELWREHVRGGDLRGRVLGHATVRRDHQLLRCRRVHRRRRRPGRSAAPLASAPAGSAPTAYCCNTACSGRPARRAT